MLRATGKRGSSRALPISPSSSRLPTGLSLVRLRVISDLAEVPLQKLQSLRPQIETRGDPEPLHLRGGGRSDAVESSDQQGFDEQGPFCRASSRC
jgi:hypothetical protein